jgi:hypothetical protein
MTKDEDLIEAIKKLDPEKLKQAVIEKLVSLKRGAETSGDSLWWVAFRSCLQNITQSLGIEIPSETE